MSVWKTSISKIFYHFLLIFWNFYEWMIFWLFYSPKIKRASKFADITYAASPISITHPWYLTWITLPIRFQFSSFRESTKFRRFIECLSGTSIPFWPSSPKKTFRINSLKFLSRYSFLWLPRYLWLLPGRVGTMRSVPSILCQSNHFPKDPNKERYFDQPILKKALRSLLNFETDLKTNIKNSGKGFFLNEWF